MSPHADPRVYALIEAKNGGLYEPGADAKRIVRPPSRDLRSQLGKALLRLPYTSTPPGSNRSPSLILIPIHVQMPDPSHICVLVCADYPVPL